MAVSNLKLGLERLYADWLGEKQRLEKQIDEISAAYETLEAKRERIENVKRRSTRWLFILAEIQVSRVRPANVADTIEARPALKKR